jgi:predicted dehydrogenase
MTILIVGGGKMGMSHLALVTQYVGKSSVALCESKALVRYLFRCLGYRTFASVESAANSLGTLTGILIATPTSSHAALARWAIGRRVPFFVEKPLTLDARRSGELSTLARDAGVPAQVGFVLRYVATFQLLRKLVANGALGHLRDYAASMRGNVITKPLPAKNWQGSFERGGGCLNEYGPHIIDLCRFIFGPVAEITSAEMDRVHSKHADDRVSVAWVHDDRTRGRIVMDWCDPTKRKSVLEIDVDFEYAHVRVDNSGFEVSWRDNAPPEVREWVSNTLPVRPANVRFYLRGEEFSLELEDFLGTCLDRNLHIDPEAPTDTAPQLADGAAVDALIDQIARKTGLK